MSRVPSSGSMSTPVTRSNCTSLPLSQSLSFSSSLSLIGCLPGNRSEAGSEEDSCSCARSLPPPVCRGEVLVGVRVGRVGLGVPLVLLVLKVELLSLDLGLSVRVERDLVPLRRRCHACS